ncbi:hypothetical protein ACFGUW_000600, partial [Enterobacter hormaechei]
VMGNRRHLFVSDEDKAHIFELFEPAIVQKIGDIFMAKINNHDWLRNIFVAHTFKIVPDTFYKVRIVIRPNIAFKSCAGFTSARFSVTKQAFFHTTIAMHRRRVAHLLTIIMR